MSLEITEEVIARQSPEGRAIIRARRCERIATKEIGVKSILKVVPTSRRVLERKFRDQLGRSVLAEIRWVRLEFDKALLSETDLSMSTIAARSGFSGPRRMAVVFKEVLGITPTMYRVPARSRRPDARVTAFTWRKKAGFEGMLCTQEAPEPADGFRQP